ncbi:hypothetical protein EX30DRAFT_337481 [Ascodesmis nigricans]|uniref:Programmed cell death protein 2 C-terminal domain-containing protein n=1 Tax=Ascodesmis nigricans TaxID=341454 RepID=A0A4S2N7E9_9PEZI|nr:hypothetical protein EX30DRAFT_337481 [Ascodesmis nigricans]
MAFDDSDSEIDDFTETSVLLGFPETESKGDDVSHLGGVPTWLHESSPADARLAKCASCNKLMSLLLQLNGAVPESPHDRMFYVWGCRSKTCRRKPGSVRAIRCVRVTESSKQQQKEKENSPVTPAPAPAPPPPTPATPLAGNMLFGNGPGLGDAGAGKPINPFSTGGASAGVNPFSSTPAGGPNNPLSAPTQKPAFPKSPTTETITKSFSSALQLNAPPPPVQEPEPILYGPPEPWPTELQHKFPHFFLDAELETLEPEKPLPEQRIEIDESGDGATSGGAEVADSKLDKVFQRFADRVAQNPEQVLRYERASLPLLYSDDDEAGKLLKDVKDGSMVGKRLPKCTNCGKKERAFEFQLMPHAITVLEGDEMSFDGMEWGTIIVATCLCEPRVKDANGVGWVEEWVGVQWEAQR